MAYIGVQPTDTYLSIASQQITGTGSATYTLDYSVSNEEDVAVFVNNVRQNVSSYTVSGNQLTLGGTISASDECWVLFLGRTVGTKTPAVGSVTNDMLAGSIANAKLANSSITLNGSAVSLGGSATTPKGVEVGELWNVAGANISTSSTTGIFTSPSAVANASVSGSAQMTQSSGVFTFPSTGYYLIQLLLNAFDNGDLHRQVVGFIKTSTNSGSSFSTVSQGNTFISFHQSNNTHQSLFTQYIFDVTNTSTHKVRFEWLFSNASLTWYADALGTTAYFQKLGDT